MLLFHIVCKTLWLTFLFSPWLMVHNAGTISNRKNKKKFTRKLKWWGTGSHKWWETGSHKVLHMVVLSMHKYTANSRVSNASKDYSSSINNWQVFIHKLVYLSKKCKSVKQIFFLNVQFVISTLYIFDCGRSYRVVNFFVFKVGIKRFCYLQSLQFTLIQSFAIDKNKYTKR